MGIVKSQYINFPWKWHINVLQVRYLLQQSTGFATGCIYMDRGLQQGDFPGEGIFDGSVIAIKTHCAK